MYYNIRKVKVTREEYQVFKPEYHAFKHNEAYVNLNQIYQDGRLESISCSPETVEVIEDFRPLTEVEMALVTGRFITREEDR